ncbi:MAG: nucleoside-diphosphate sugar epimerase [Lentisphaerae bacterium GWF2_52_8]|nr:MAG: nucleoside-diphosphate sugar epimerase [Lentisphaerae bacterium GWF2_52_8]
MIPLKGRKIAIVGGAGFIGHNLSLELKRQGADVEIVDGLEVNNLMTFMSADCIVKNKDIYLRMINERLAMLRDNGIPLHVQDAREYHQLNKILSKIQPQVIILLAAVAHADRSNKDPHSTFDHSLRTLENALDYARSSEKGTQVEHFVYFSSSMAYGNFPKDGFVTEETPCDPLGIYGALKFAGEKIVTSYNQAFNIPYTIVRPSALYGERCVSRRVGQIFIENALQGLEVTVNGDGSDRVDFTYIDDLMSGVVCVLTNENSRNQVFNLTYGDSRSISDMGNLLKESFPDVKVKYVPKDRLTPSRGTLSVDKARKMIGYNPQWPLEKGFRKYIEWYKGFWK